MKHSLNTLGLSDLRNVILFESCVTSHIVNQLEQYKDLYLHEPQKNWDPEEFNKRVYERAVVDELELLARLNPEMDIYEIIDAFLEDLLPAYNAMETPVETFEILSVFVDTLYDIRDWI